MIDSVLVKAVYAIAQAICKKKGYASTPSESDVEIVWTAILMLNNEIERVKK